MLDERGEEDRNGGGHLGLAATATDDAPQLTHALRWWCAAASNTGEGTRFFAIESEPEGGLEHCAPGLPGVDVTQGGAEQAPVDQRALDSQTRVHSLASTAFCSISTTSAFSACSCSWDLIAARYWSSEGTISRGILEVPMMRAIRTSDEVSKLYSVMSTS